MVLKMPDRSMHTRDIPHPFIRHGEHVHWKFKKIFLSCMQYAKASWIMFY